MRRFTLLVLVFVLVSPTARGQAEEGAQQTRDFFSIPDVVTNQIQSLAAAGDSLWSGPLLTLYLEPEDRPEPSDRLLLADVPALTEEDNVAVSIAARNAGPLRALVWAGLAFDTGGGGAGAGGFLVSNDGGASFTRRGPQLDSPSDTTITYGVSTLPARPITQQVQSPPQDLAFGPRADTVWVAGLRSGLRWSVDDGQSWRRAVLPSDTSQSVDPATETNMFVSPPLETGQGNVNHLAYSVLVDETGTVWAGTAGGLNRSDPDGVTPAGHRPWQRFTVENSDTGPTGDVVVSLAEQPVPGRRNPIWIASWARERQGARRQRFGVTVTEDGGESFRQALVGERVYDLAARTSLVYAAGETGLFVSKDRGRTWRSVEQFPLTDDTQTLPTDVETRAVAATDAALWVATTDGLLRLDRADEPRLVTGNPEWALFRAETPVNPERPSDQVPDVSTYAYPNPFVPSRDELCRIVYELDEASTVEVNIYDYGMSHVRTLTDQQPAGQQETVWRGRDQQGLRVPTGTYFYTVDLGDRTVEGKILVAN